MASYLDDAARDVKASLAREAPASRVRMIALAYLGLALAALCPLLLVDIPPLVDYANHLARYHVIASIGESPTLQALYEVRWALLPNLALDVVAPALMKVLSPYDAGRLVVALGLLLIVGGAAAVHVAVFGRVGLWPAAAFLFVYNFVLAWGFLNYLITMALVLFAIAAWVGLRSRSPWLRLPLFAAVASTLFLGHLLACAAYAVFIAAYEAERAFKARGTPLREILGDGAIAASQFAIPIVLWLMTPTGQGETYTIYGDLMDKVAALFSPTLYFDTALERASMVLIGAALIRGLFGGYIVVARGFAWPLIALTAIAVAMPSMLLSVAKVDLRLPLLILLLLLGVSRLRLPSPRYAAVLAVAGLALFAARVASVADTWQAFDRSYAEFRVAAAQLERGARVLSVQYRPGGEQQPNERFFWHLATLSIIDRDAFSPTFFADPVKHPVRVRAVMAHLHSHDVEPIAIETLVSAADPRVSAELAARKYPHGYRAYWAFWPERFDYVVVMHFGRQPANPVPRHLARIAQGSYFDLYRVVR